MKHKYLFRLDDACDTMDWEKWVRMEKIFDKYNVKPLIAIIPNNKDTSLKIDRKNEGFWNWVQSLVCKGWEIGLHGYDHVYITNDGGINPIHKRSEFAGLSLKDQRDKIKKGYEIMNKNGLRPKYFVAPSHTFDKNTITALKCESEIGIISDTIAFKPYKEKNMLFFPQQFGLARKIPFDGIYTFCYHPNTMKLVDFKNLEHFLERNYNNLASFDEIINNSTFGPKTVLDKVFSMSYFMFRKIMR